jgi:hypothetical protein
MGSAMAKHEPFIMLPYGVYDSLGFTALRPIHLALLLALIRKHNGRNNGAIAFGIREAARRCHCGKSTAARALADLQTAGLISAVYRGHLVPEVGRPDATSRWRLEFVQEISPRDRAKKAPRCT